MTQIETPTYNITKPFDPEEWKKLREKKEKMLLRMWERWWEHENARSRKSEKRV